MKKNLLCIINAPSLNTKILRDEVFKSIERETEDINIKLLGPFETLITDILNADAILLGTTENLSSMAGATKDLFDRTYNDLLHKKEGMPIAIWIRAGHDGTGTVRQLESIIKGLKWRLIQDILVCRGEWQKKFIDQCLELSLGLAVGIDNNIY